MASHRLHTCNALLIASLLFATACTPPTEREPTADSTTVNDESAANSSPAGDASSGAIEASEEEEKVAAGIQGESETKSDEIVLKLASYEEQQEMLQQFTGKVVVLDIWSTSCIPCMREFPNLVALSKKYPEQVAAIALNVDYIGLKNKPPESCVPKVEEFLTKQQATTTQNLLSTDADEKILQEYGVPAIPAIFIYDAEGNLQKTLTDDNAGEDGLTYEGDVIPFVEQLLASQ